MDGLKGKKKGTLLVDRLPQVYVAQAGVGRQSSFEGLCKEAEAVGLATGWSKPLSFRLNLDLPLECHCFYVPEGYGRGFGPKGPEIGAVVRVVKQPSDLRVNGNLSGDRGAPCTSRIVGEVGTIEAVQSTVCSFQSVLITGTAGRLMCLPWECVSPVVGVHDLLSISRYWADKVETLESEAQTLREEVQVLRSFVGLYRS